MTMNNTENTEQPEARGSLHSLVRRISHDFLGWHNCSGEQSIRWDGCSLEGRCTCGKSVLLDSQGNWFATEDSPNDPKLSDRRSWRGACVAAATWWLAAGTVTAEPVRWSAWLGVADELEKGADSICEFVSAGSGCVTGKKLRRETTQGFIKSVELVSSFFGDVATHGCGFLAEGARTEEPVVSVVCAVDLFGWRSLGQLLALDEKALKSTQSVLSGDSGSFGSGLTLASQGSAVDDNPASDDDERSPYTGGERRFWLAYARVMPLTVLAWGLSCWLCYRHGCWVGRGSDDDRRYR